MSLSRISSRAHLLPFLQHSRCATDVLWSNYKYTRANICCTGVCCLMPRCGYGTNMISRNRKPQSFGSGLPLEIHSFSSIQRRYASHASTEQKSRKMLLYLTTLVFAMVGSSYAAVPLYRRFCQATGYGGTVQRKESVEEKIAGHAKDGTVATREIVVQFNADVADGMPWKFISTQREVRVKPGKSALAFCTAENRSYNVTPMKRLLRGEQIDMPVFFYIDTEFETDRRMDGINNLILSYTFFKVNEE